MTDKTKNVLFYLQSIGDKKVTSEEVAAALGTTARSVDATYTMGIVKKNLGVRVPAQRLSPVDGVTYENVNYLVLTDAGVMFKAE